MFNMRVPEKAMTVSRYDDILFELACKHAVVVGRLQNVETWKCEQCGRVTDLRQSPYREQLALDLDACDQIDKQARQRGNAVIRQTKGGV